MDRARQEQAAKIAKQVIEFPADQRQQAAKELCAGDEELRMLVHRMLSAAGKSKSTSTTAKKSVESSSKKTGNEPKVAGFEILGRLGKGGMGVVWEALQLSTRRRVALKLLSEKSLGSSTRRGRFVREVELAASLEHPNIARIYDSGLNQGVYHYAMELVRGEPLDDYVKQHNLELDQILRLLREICLAMEYAHSSNVVHRDLKPSNILVDAKGRPHILDFGLAKLLDSDESGVRPAVSDSKITSADSLDLSMDGDITGTPMYMSPEQAAGEINKIDARSDVYSLGVIAYRLLTGSSPHDLNGTTKDVIRRIAKQDVRLPRSTGAKLDPEVEAILLKALSRKPAERYVSAGEFAEDIDNYTENRPLLARKATPLYLLKKKLSRNRRTTIVSAASCVAVVVIWIGLLPNGWLRDLLLLTKTIQVTQTQTTVVKESVASSPTTEASNATLATVTSIKNRAEAAWNAVKEIDRNQGFGQKLDAAKELKDKAQALLDKQMYDDSAGKYRDLLKACDDILDLNESRKQAVIARDDAKASSDEAQKASADRFTADLWTRSQSSSSQAATSFEGADFSSAQSHWQEAVKATTTALPVATAARDYDTLLKTQDVSLLEKFGGADWASCKDAAQRADSAEKSGDYDASIDSYKEAKRLLQLVTAAVAMKSSPQEQEALTRLNHAQSYINSSQFLLANLDLTALGQPPLSQTHTVQDATTQIKGMQSQVDANLDKTAIKDFGNYVLYTKTSGEDWDWANAQANRLGAHPVRPSGSEKSFFKMALSYAFFRVFLEDGMSVDDFEVDLHSIHDVMNISARHGYTGYAPGPGGPTQYVEADLARVALFHNGEIFQVQCTAQGFTSKELQTTPYAYGTEYAVPENKNVINAISGREVVYRDPVIPQFTMTLSGLRHALVPIELKLDPDKPTFYGDIVLRHMPPSQSGNLELRVKTEDGFALKDGVLLIGNDDPVCNAFATGIDDFTVNSFAARRFRFGLQIPYSQNYGDIHVQSLGIRWRHVTVAPQSTTAVDVVIYAPRKITFEWWDRKISPMSAWQHGIAECLTGSQWKPSGQSGPMGLRANFLDWSPEGGFIADSPDSRVFPIPGFKSPASVQFPTQNIYEGATMWHPLSAGQAFGIYGFGEQAIIQIRDITKSTPSATTIPTTAPH